MKEQILKDLADKFGTTIDHLWGVLIKQAPITASFDILGYSLLWLLVVIVTKKVTTKVDEEYKWIVLTVAFVFILILLPCTINDLSIAFAGFFNPEYWALKQIIK